MITLDDRPDPLLIKGSPTSERQNERSNSNGERQEASYSQGKRLPPVEVNKRELMTIDVFPQEDKSVQNTPLIEVLVEDQGNKMQLEERLPLLECTNQKLSRSSEEGKKRISGTKGQ